MNETDFQLFLWLMSGMAAIVFVALQFVKAGYGIFRTPSWGWTVPNKVAWVLMEAPVFLVMLLLWNRSDAGCSLPALLFFLLFQLHYFQRSFIFPLLLRGKSRMPISIVAMGVVFNVLNGCMQAGGLFYFPPEAYAEGWGYLSHAWVWAGILLFFLGMAVNIHSDRVIRRLRQPGDTAHYLPAGGMYRYVTSANYLGELLEWTGFALAAHTAAAWVFVLWTAANLIPRAAAIHHRYREEFGQAVGKRKRIIPYIY